MKKNAKSGFEKATAKAAPKADNSVYVVTWKTEASDEGVECFAECPTDEHLTAYFKHIMPDEFIKEGSEEICLITWDVQKMKPKKLPKAVKAVHKL